MSYDIIYNKQFVKLRKTGEVIPMLLSGSNNCFEIGVGGRDGRRSRDWSSFRYYNRKGKISEKPEIILSKLDAEIGRYIRRHRGDGEAKPAEIRKHFGYYASLAVGGGSCSSTSWDRWRSQLSNGIKNALTIEELADFGVYLHFFYHDYGDKDTSEGRPAPINLRTEQEYFVELKKWREWQAKFPHTPSLTFSPSSTDVVLERLRAPKRKAPREKARVEQDHYFVLAGEDGNLMRYTSRGFRYSYSNTGGKKFKTEKDAEARRQELVKKERYKADTWKVKRVEGTATFWV